MWAKLKSFRYDTRIDINLDINMPCQLSQYIDKDVWGIA